MKLFQLIVNLSLLSSYAETSENYFLQSAVSGSFLVHQEINLSLCFSTASAGFLFIEDYKIMIFLILLYCLLHSFQKFNLFIRHIFNIPYKCNFDQHSLAYQSPSVSNIFPFELRYKETMVTFRKTLKVHLFHQQDQHYLSCVICLNRIFVNLLYLCLECVKTYLFV